MPKKTKKKPQVVLKKRVIYVEIDDSISDVHDKLRQIKAKRIYLVVPHHAMLFQSVVNLKILKKYADEEKKRIYFITNDVNGVNLAERLGIRVYDKVNNDEGPSLFSSDADDEKLKITPLRATVNSVEEHAPTRLAEKKLAISEILKMGGKKKKVAVAASEKKSKKKGSGSGPRFRIIAPNKSALVALISFTAIVLVAIFYIALPGATVYLTPSASILEKSVNITLADYDKNHYELDTHPAHMIASYPISLEVEKTIEYDSTGKRVSEQGANSSGKLTIVNNEAYPWPLIERTRFQTEEGIVFRIYESVEVPSNSRLEVAVVADEVDAYGGVVGDRGNIEPSRFFLPGLREDSRDKLYAESSEPMTGGITDFISYVSQEDIEAARAKMRTELGEVSVEELKVAVDLRSEEAENDVTYVLLDGQGAMKLGEPDTWVPGDVLGKEVERFEVNGKVSVSGLYYDRDAMLEILKGELITKKSPSKELLRINEKSTSYRIFDWDDASGKVKLTANIKGIEQYDIDDESETGEKLLEKIREHIAGKDIEFAKKYIQNLPQINKVKIESWPAWAPTIPNLAENIDFEVREAIMVQ